MRITFLLPTPGDTPIGGVKIIYEHANRLAADGHAVTVVHTMTGQTRDRGLLFSIATFLGRRFGLRGGFSPKKWMHVNSNINCIWAPTLSKHFIPTGDVIVATAWTTAEAAIELPESYGIKYYFIQDYEFFMTAAAEIRERMAATYRGAFRNLVISPACRDMVIDCGGAVYAEVPNGLDLDHYKLTVPIDSPERKYIGFPARSEPFKRTDDAITALTLYKERNPNSDYKFWCFGGVQPQNLPSWIEFHLRPTDSELVELYNHTAIFIVPSQYEGWGLPGSEAMCCGAALISTDNGGVNAYAIHNRNALICQTMEPKNILYFLEKIITTPNLRINLATEAHTHLQSFTWERAFFLFKAVLDI
ncbi:glycosyltransferase family 4 protein [Ampullimonas aquatilis]|uniref:glycosyltransferase family 4 protein n=1 Tax=Ampullimonas aquatilis TaxID=1341549 RepID=UPI003C78331E